VGYGDGGRVNYISPGRVVWRGGLAPCPENDFFLLEMACFGEF